MKILKRILKSDKTQSFVAILLYSYLRLVEKTNKWYLDFPNFKDEKGNQKTFLILIWHGRLIMGPCFFKLIHPCATVISGHRDGMFISKVARMFGSGVITGSSRRGGVAALVNSIAHLNSGKSLIITPDGPKGPAKKIQGNLLAIAKKTGVPIILVGYSCSRAKIFDKSWDSFMLPYPFAKSALIASEPFYVSDSFDEKKLVEEREYIESKMNELTLKADKIVGRNYDS